MEAIKESVIALAHTPQYRMHKYFARRPYNVFSNLIEYYTKPNDIVYDCFCGGGVTIFESLKNGRKAVGVDLNPLSTMITETQIFTKNLDELKTALDIFLNIVRDKCEKYYSFEKNGLKGKIIWTEWVYTVKCPECGNIIELTELNKISNGIFKCSNKNCSCKSGFERFKSQFVGIRPIKAKIKDELGNIQVVEIDNIDEVLPYKAEIDEMKSKTQYDCLLPLDDMDRQKEDKLKERGITKYSDLFTARNFVLSCIVFDEILKLKNRFEKWIIDYIYLSFSSTLRYVNNMTRVTENWENGNPTSMDKHAFWFPNQFVENNIVCILEKRINAVVNGCEFSKRILSVEKKKCSKFEDLVNSDFMILNQSSDNVPFPDKSVNMVITDPPYGSNVQYAELSIIWNHWLNFYRNTKKDFLSDKEAVVHRRLDTDKKKTVTTYKNMLTKIFGECNRVLKDDGFLVFTFNNKNMNVWLAMLKGVSDSGFE